MITFALTSRRLTDESVKLFIERLRYAAELVRTVQRHFNYERRDVTDEPYINLASEVEAHYLVSRVNDLLDLMNGIEKTGASFKNASERCGL